MTADSIRARIANACSPERFFVAVPLRLRIEHLVREQVAWELFRGHLLDPAQTRQFAMFEAWSVFLDSTETAAPHWLISIKVDWTANRLHVVRAVEVFGWEAHAVSGNVVESRETVKWHRELVGTVELLECPETSDFEPRLALLLRMALTGTSRLPITSLESPLPAFALGQLAYLSPSHATASPGTIEQLLAATADDKSSSPFPWFEFALRAARHDEVPALCRSLMANRREQIPDFLRRLFNGLALSPLTGFIDNILAFIREWRGSIGVAEPRAIVGYMLRHLARHLTAYDLTTFHNFGANYPDAILLDGLLKLWLDLAEADREAVHGPLDFRALRQGWLARKECEGLPVPDHPTSPGENLRVMPPWLPRLPEAQITQPSRRTKRLFADEPTGGLLSPAGRRTLELAIGDFSKRLELRELGMATFLDRPLGVLKARGEVDRTPLLSYEAFSPAIARRRLELLRKSDLIAEERFTALATSLNELALIPGVLALDLPDRERPGVVALEDSLRASKDFRFLRTTRSSLLKFLDGYHFRPLAESSPAASKWLQDAKGVLLIRSPRLRLRDAPTPFLTAFDAAMRPRLEFAVVRPPDQPPDYRESDGVEYLADGLLLLRVWESNQEPDCIPMTFETPIVLPPR